MNKEKVEKLDAEHEAFIKKCHLLSFQLKALCAGYSDREIISVLSEKMLDVTMEQNDFEGAFSQLLCLLRDGMADRK